MQRKIFERETLENEQTDTTNQQNEKINST